MIIRTSKWGLSIGLRLPAAIASELDIQAGDYLKIDSNDRGEIVLWPAKEDVSLTSDSDADQSDASATGWHDEDVLEAPEGW